MVIGLDPMRVLGENMSKHVFKAALRTSDFGSAGSRRLVRAGKIPAVIYGRKQEPVHIVIDSHAFEQSLHTISETTLITLRVDGEDYEVLVKDYHENILKNLFHHVDFYAVVRGEKLRTAVSLTVEGNPVGCRMGGILDVILYEIEIECLPKDLPSTIKVDVSDVELNGTLTVRDLIIPEGVEVLTHLDETVVNVQAPREEVVEEEEETEEGDEAEETEEAETEE